MDAFDYLVKEIVRHHDADAADVVAWTEVVYYLTFVYYMDFAGMYMINLCVGCILIASLQAHTYDKSQIAARSAGNRQIGEIVKQYYIVIYTTEI